MNEYHSPKYCGECKVWTADAEDYRINKTNASDCRDIEIPCPEVMVMVRV